MGGKGGRKREAGGEGRGRVVERKGMGRARGRGAARRVGGQPVGVGSWVLSTLWTSVSLMMVTMYDAEKKSWMG